MSWLSGYGYRKQFPINGTTAGAQTNYQMRLVVHKGSGSDSGDDVYLNNHCQDDFDDIRFTKSDGETELDHWRESYVSGDYAIFWIEFDSMPASPSSANFYIYYNKSDATSASNGDNTFPFFDDFPGASLDTSKWNSEGTIEVSGSEVTLNQDDVIWGKTAFGYNYEVRAKSKADEQDTVFVAFAIASDHDEGAGAHLGISNSDAVYPNDFDRFRLQANKDASTRNSYYTDGLGDFRNTYYIYYIQRKSGQAKAYQDGSLIKSLTDATYLPTIDLYPDLSVWDSSQASTLICDWIFIRKYADPEPTWGTWGSEETPPKHFGVII